MIKMSYHEISNFGFTQAVQKLAGTPMNTRLAYAIKKIVDELNRGRKKVSTEYQAEIVAKYAKKDAEGKIIHPEGHPEAFDIDETHKEAFTKDQEAFGIREYEINRAKLTLADLDNVKLSAQDLSMLEPLYEGEPDEVPENVKAIR